MKRRRICWPKFDKVCLEGGCLYCNDYPFRPVAEIWDMVNVPFGAEMREAFTYGEEQGWNHAESKG